MSEQDAATEALILADAYMQARNYRRAAEVLSDVLAGDPRHVEVLVELARAQHALGEHREAERSVSRAIASAPDNATAMCVLAAALGGQHRWAAAVLWAHKAVLAAPGEVAAHHEYARALLGSGDPKAALPVIARLLATNHADVEARVLKGKALSDLKLYWHADAEFVRALKQEPTHAGALHARAANLARRGGFTHALAGFRRAAAVDPTIGDDVRAAMMGTLRAWLGGVTLGAWALTQVATRIEQFDSAAGTSRTAQMAAGIGALVLGGVCLWVARSLPAGAWRKLLGAGRASRGLKIYIGLCALVIISLAAFALGAPIGVGVLSCVLVATVGGIYLAPALDKEDDRRGGPDRDQDPYRAWNREA